MGEYGPRSISTSDFRVERLSVRFWLSNPPDRMVSGDLIDVFADDFEMQSAAGLVR